jgi:thiol-disulfide isomerase/thioredoxin
MRRIVFVFILTFMVTLNHAQPPAVGFDQLKPRLSTGSDTVYVVNFWATWCVPCVKELPEFEKLNEVYGDRKVKVLLVSLDNPRHMNSRVIPFIEQHNLKSEIVLLDDPRSNRWIPEVDESWSGAIPATVFFTKDSRSFYERAFTYDELENIVQSKLN